MKKTAIIYVILVLLASVVFYVVTLRSTGSRSSWICVNNQWVKFGNPSGPAPTSTCVGSQNPGATTRQEPLTVNFTEAGVIAKENEPPVGWEFTYGGSTAHLFFVNASVCDLGKGPATCSMSKSVMNIEGSTVKIEGEKNGAKVIVAKLTFIK